MKRIAMVLVVAALASTAMAQRTVQVDGHVRKDGTYVPPHYRTAPDSSRMNNWSSQGNANPYTGQQGTVNPYSPPSYDAYGQQPRQNNPYGLP